MNEIMRWLAHYNTLVIQVVFTIVLVLLAVYVYRLFYVPQSSSDSGSQIDMNEMTQRLSHLMKSNMGSEAVRSAEASAAVATAAGGATASALDSSEDPAVLKAEINRLKEQLNEAERKIFELTPTSGAAANPATATEAAFGIQPEATAQAGAASTASTENTGDPQAQQKIQDLQKTIDQLQARLDEYDIISEDIAELSSLRAENTQLKKKIEELSAGGAAESTKVAEQSPDVEAVEEESAVTASVDEVDKNLISEFEKSTEKGSE